MVSDFTKSDIVDAYTGDGWWVYKIIEKKTVDLLVFFSVSKGRIVLIRSIKGSSNLG